MEPINLVIFTSEGREHLVGKTFETLKKYSDIAFDKILVSVDGQYDMSVLEGISPDIILHHFDRKGYVNSIYQILKLVDSRFFFWVEDDWCFHQILELQNKVDILNENEDWAEIYFSKFEILKSEYKTVPLAKNLYLSPFGFSANPAICNTQHLKKAFDSMLLSPKGQKLGEDGFENYLTRYFNSANIKCIIEDSPEGRVISHEGYLESTPRIWHMTNSLHKKSNTHLLILPKPSFVRKLGTMIKLYGIIAILSIKQFNNDKIYEYCFRVIISGKKINKD